MNILKYQKQSLDLISKSMGLPTFDESLEGPASDDIKDKDDMKERANWNYDCIENEIEYELEKKQGLHNEARD